MYTLPTIDAIKKICKETGQNPQDINGPRLVDRIAWDAGTGELFYRTQTPDNNWIEWADGIYQVYTAGTAATKPDDIIAGIAWAIYYHYPKEYGPDTLQHLRELYNIQ